MRKNLKKWVGLLAIVSLMAAYAACSKSTLKSDIAVSKDASPVGSTLKSAACTCANCTPYNVDSVYILRDPNCSSGGCQPYRLAGITFNCSTIISVTTITCGTSISTCNSSYDMYFYSEKTDPNCGVATPKATGQPLLILDTTRVKAIKVGTGIDTFNLYTCFNTNCSPGWVTDADCYTLPLGIGYRCGVSTCGGSSCADTLCKSAVTTLANGMVIGNNFQNTSDDYGPSDQAVYLLKVYDEESEDYCYYVCMVSRYINGSGTGDPATNKKYMTLRYRKLSTCSE